MTIEEFEQQLMTALLAGNDPILETLRAQHAAATVRERQVTQSGFVTRFEIPSSAPGIERKLMHLDDLQLQLEGVQSPADCSLHVYQGRLRSLECFVYEGTFPEKPSVLAAWYYGTEKYPGITPELTAAREIEELLEEDE